MKNKYFNLNIGTTVYLRFGVKLYKFIVCGSIKNAFSDQIKYYDSKGEFLTVWATDENYEYDNWVFINIEDAVNAIIKLYYEDKL